MMRLEYFRLVPSIQTHYEIPLYKPIFTSLYFNESMKLGFESLLTASSSLASEAIQTLQKMKVLF